MATVTQAPHTPEALLEIHDRPMPELVDGQLVERPPMGQRSDAIASRIGRLLGNFVDEHRLGVMNGSQGSYQIFPDDPRKVRIPDVSFTRRERLPAGRIEEGHGKVAPDLVVEVISPNDLAGDVRTKVNDFINAGVPLIWVVYPDACEVEVHRPDGTSVLVRGGDNLDGGDVLPGFRCAVADLFTI
jgi:Uma2 family endonuclease